MKEWMELQIDSKEEIRKYILNKKENLSENEKKDLDELIFNNIINCPWFLEAKVIFSYVSFEKEVDTHRIIKHAFSLGKKVCVPKVISRAKGMKALYIESLEELTKGKMGILEPSESKEALAIDDIDMAIVPGVAFDNSGGRLGYGGGFYDRFFIDAKVKKIALAYEFQILKAVPKEKHDILMDKIITEKTLRNFNNEF
jgi:5-formyltetrahydrofolate cyclo-ligase